MGYLDSLFTNGSFIAYYYNNDSMLSRSDPHATPNPHATPHATPCGPIGLIEAGVTGDIACCFLIVLMAKCNQLPPVASGCHKPTV